VLIDKKYLSIITSKFKIVDKGNHKVCRCPICGDSQRDKSKMRGYFIINGKRKRMNYFCHNCDANMLLGTFIKLYAPAVYADYKKERAFDSLEANHKPTKPRHEDVEPVLQYTVRKPKLEAVTEASSEPPTIPRANRRVLQHLTPIMNAPISIQKYLYERKIPVDIAKKYIFYTDEFMAYTNKHIPAMFSEGAVAAFDEPRIVILMFDETGECVGFQGRRLPNSEAQAKYITIKLNENEGKIWGLDRVDKAKPIIVFEGPVDATFVENAIAVCGSDLVSQTLHIDTYQTDEYVYGFDNEPRNKQIVKRMDSAIKAGLSVIIWPKEVKQKDINDMILSGVNVNEIIRKHTYQGLTARIKFTTWRKF